MDGLTNFLFPTTPDATSVSVFLLAARIVFGSLMMYHGIQKCLNFKSLSLEFPALFGMSSKTSLMLAIFGELVCSVGFVFGFLYRLALLPMIFTMYAACFVALRKAPLLERELPFLYLIIYIFMFLAGPGRFAIDQLFVG